MFHRKVEREDHFWLGFVAGAVAGGLLGAIFASEAGRKARVRLGSVVDEVRGRFNGRHGDRELEPSEAEQEEGHPS